MSELLIGLINPLNYDQVIEFFKRCRYPVKIAAGEVVGFAVDPLDCGPHVFQIEQSASAELDRRNLASGDKVFESAGAEPQRARGFFLGV